MDTNTLLYLLKNPSKESLSEFLKNKLIEGYYFKSYQITPPPNALVYDDSIDWDSIYKDYETHFNELWKKIVNPKLSKRLEEYSFYYKWRMLDLVKCKIYKYISEYIDFAELKEKDYKKHSLQIIKFAENAIEESFRIFYEEEAIINLKEPDVQKIIDTGKLFLAGQKYPEDILESFKEVQRIYDNELKNKENPRSLRAIAFQVAVTLGYGKEKEKENYYKKFNRFKNKGKTKKRKYNSKKNEK